MIRAVGVETGGSNVQFAVDPAQRRDRRDRDEPARLALLGAGLEGDRLPDREDRGAARGRLRARGDPQRHHAARRRRASSRRSTTSSSSGRASRSRSSRGVDAGLTTHMKSVGEAMAIGRTFAPGVRQGDALARARRRSRTSTSRSTSCSSASRSPGATATTSSSRRCAAARRVEQLHERTSIDPWFLRELAAIATDPEAAFAGVRTLQVGRHLRRRVRGEHALLLLGAGSARCADGGAADEVVRGERPTRRDPRLGAQPDRPGDRVRLLLRARRDDRARVAVATP